MDEELSGNPSIPSRESNAFWIEASSRNKQNNSALLDAIGIATADMHVYRAS
jgi:hypothetical protein